MLGKILVEIFPTLAALQIYQKNGRAHFEDNVSKHVSKNHAQIVKKLRKSAFLEPCRADLAAEAQKCTPEVAKLVQLGGILEVKLGLKFLKNRFNIRSIFGCFSKLSWRRKLYLNHSKMEAEIDSKTLSKELGSESGESVISNNTIAF